ncbi:MAG: sulfite exporter TauE/SafE family protein [Planctomycetota bacterium]
MDLAWPAIFAASLVGSMHCAGMCGPLVAVVMADSGTRKGRRAAGVPALLAAYHAARGFAYTVLGAAAGAAGQLTDLGFVLAGLQPVAAVLAALTLVATGLLMGLRHLGARAPRIAVPARFQAFVRGLQSRALRLPPLTRALSVGGVTALLPCGWLYAFATVAAATASPALGAAVMLAFWAGSVPVLSALGLGVRATGGLLGPRLRPVFSVTLIAAGMWALVGRSQLDADGMVQSVEAAASAQSTPDLGAEPACCAAEGGLPEGER